MSEGTISARGPVGRQLIKMFRRERNRTVVSFAAVSEGFRHAAELQQSEASLGDISETDPSHAWYVAAQRQLSIFVETTSSLPATERLADAINEAQEEYMPLGPPMSPLTGSYFFFWSVCDFSPNGDGETLGSATLDLVREIGTDPLLLGAMDTLEQSRMGLWVHQGRDGDGVVLRELLTDEVARCVVPAGYLGAKGEVWFARVLPPGTPGLASVVMTTPYVLVRTSAADWLAYLKRALKAYPPAQWRTIYPLLMKYGVNPRYWPEYVFEGYVNHRDDVVFLTGFPDIEASRPHSRINSGF